MSKEHLDLIAIRAGGPEDLHLVHKTWLESSCESALARALWPAYRRGHGGLLLSVLRRPGVRLRVACARDEPSTVVGWAALDGASLLYVFVKDDFRRQGIAGHLLANVPITNYATLTDTARSWDKVPSAWRYEPYRLLAPEI